MTAGLYVGETSRQCGTCGEVKPYDAFSPRGYVAGVRVYKSTCKPCCAARARAWCRDNRARHAATRHAREMRVTYGISAEHYEQLLVEQHGRCAICGQDEPSAHGRTGTPFRLAVDHDHQTGRVRGLLCQKCNRAIGLLNDDPDRLAAAIDYLRKG